MWLAKCVLSEFRNIRLYCCYDYENVGNGCNQNDHNADDKGNVKHSNNQEDNDIGSKSSVINDDTNDTNDNCKNNDDNKSDDNVIVTKIYFITPFNIILIIIFTKFIVIFLLSLLSLSL